MKEKKPEILFSETVKEILGTPPGRIVRWGTFALFGVFLLFFILSWIIRYPDVIRSSIEITTQNPPVTLTSKISGHIERLYVREKDTVSIGQLLAVMETTASVSEIHKLRSVTDTIKNLQKVSGELMPGFSELGELQSYYSDFLKNLYDLNSYDSNDFNGSKITSLAVEIESLKSLVKELIVKEALLEDNRRLELKKFNRDSIIFASGAISESALESSSQSFLRVKIELQDVILDISEKNVLIAEKQQMLQGYRIKKTEDREKLVTILRESYLNLKAQIKIWEELYLLISPIDGVVSFTKYWSVNQSVLKDDPVMNIVPVQSGDFLGRIYLGMYRSGKVKPGQSVNIKLSGYPYLEYGVVKGIVKSKSLVPSEDTYVIDVFMPEGLKTLYGITLDLNQKMQGNAEIITDDVTILQKIMNPFRYMITRNRR
jgi:multidrug efflux pump subunit AcrA (membrane-fusion protein)